ncbi:MAG: RnfABCDGE type electron transport complex subunit D [Flavobacteriales bacterium]|nr:RnfABCDGE type electron transport complex subunit D [Flavobacteriales bacterium]
MKLAQILSAERDDPRCLQIFLLSSFLIYGFLFLNWSSSWEVFASALGSTAFSQWIWIRYRGGSLHSLKSAMISGLGLCLLLKVDSSWVMALAGILTISSKYLLRYQSKHIFNPTNFGIIVTVFFGHAWIDPGQWGQGDSTLALIVLGAVGILLRVKRWDLSVTFLGSMFFLEALRLILYLGWDFPVLFHRFESGTILLFAFFMITDPKTTPNSRKGRVIWGVLIASVSFVLGQYFYLYEAPLIALFTISLTTPLLDLLYKAERFSWTIKTQNI